MNISSQTKYATFPQRLFAFNIDFLVFLVTAVLLSFLIKDDYWFWGILFSLVCVYHAAFESSGWQATFGKKYANILVVNELGRRLTFFQALLRIITKYLSLLLFFGGFFMIYFRKDRRGLHDVLVKTYVVNRSN
ncbi:MAG: RDD family protein [Reichenbachiella sp.]|uniref:RDD family protein n=1 Tax=Reichenbachiella sp. TaxID=2184521 RepID=UPI0032973EF1